MSIFQKVVCKSGSWPFKWDFLTDWNFFILDLIEPKEKFHGPDVPEFKITIDITRSPFNVMVFYNRKLKLWIGEKTWKKALKENQF